jgi:hypothetical protein
MFNKNKKTEIKLMRDKEVVYVVTVEKKSIELKSASGDWSVRYGIETMEAVYANFLISQGRLDELTGWIRIQYMMRIEVRFLMLSEYRVKKFIESLKMKSAELEKVRRDGEKQSQAEILAEQKVLHEQTAESISELENTKKHGKTATRK